MSAANPYAVLGVPEDASAAEIKKAYRRQMRLAAVDIHPDVSDAETVRPMKNGSGGGGIRSLEMHPAPRPVNRTTDLAA